MFASLALGTGCPIGAVDGGLSFKGFSSCFSGRAPFRILDRRSEYVQAIALFLQKEQSETPLPSHFVLFARQASQARGLAEGS